MTDIVEELLAREQIREVVVRYCRGIDAGDFDAVASCFTEDATLKHGRLDGTPNDLISFVKRFKGILVNCCHCVGGAVVVLDGDKATCESTFSAYHRIKPDDTGLSPVPTNGVETDWLVAGRYVDEMICENGVWRIQKRQGIHDWERIEPAL